MHGDHEAVAAALPAYEIGAELGRGAWGQVFAGRHRRLDRDVAIKQLAPSFGSDPAVQARFLTEGRLLASLDHPHVVAVYDFVESDGLCLLVMELMRGGSVADRGWLAPPVVCALGLAACAGLHHAHERGLLHRDVKPDNLMFSTSGVPKVGDFGIAKVLGGPTTGVTVEGSLLGTPAFMAPEQITAGPLTPATDVYALALSLYLLLARRIPFSEGDVATMLYERVHLAPMPLLRADPRLPPQVGHVVDAGLATDWNRRPQSAELFGIALANAARAAWGPMWLTGTGIVLAATGPIADAAKTPTPAPGPSPPRGPPPPPEPSRGVPPPASEPGRRLGPVIALVAGLSAGLAVIIAVGAALLLSRGDDEKPAARAGSGPAAPGPPAPGVWVVTNETTVTRVDPRRSAVSATISSVGRKIVDIAVGEGAIWAADEIGRQVVRIDPATNRVMARIRVGETPGAIAAGEGGVFVVGRTNTVLRIDPRSNTVANLREEEEPPYDLEPGLGYVWGANFIDGDVKRINPDTLEVTSVTSGLGEKPREVGVGEGAVWVIAADAKLTRLTQPPGGASPTAKTFATDTGEFPSGLAVGEGAVWLTEANKLWRYDPKTGSLDATIELGGFVANGIAVGRGHVWLSRYGEQGGVVRVNTRTNVVDTMVEIPGSTEQIAVSAAR